MRTASAVPLALDKGFVQTREDEYEDVSEDSVDVEEEDVQTRVEKARTIFHQPNGDSDTV